LRFCDRQKHFIEIAKIIRRRTARYVAVIFRLFFAGSMFLGSMHAAIDRNQLMIDLIHLGNEPAQVAPFKKR